MRFSYLADKREIELESWPDILSQQPSMSERSASNLQFDKSIVNQWRPSAVNLEALWPRQGPTAVRLTGDLPGISLPEPVPWIAGVLDGSVDRYPFLWEAFGNHRPCIWNPGEVTLLVSGQLQDHVSTLAVSSKG